MWKREEKKHCDEVKKKYQHFYVTDRGTDGFVYNRAALPTLGVDCLTRDNK